MAKKDLQAQSELDRSSEVFQWNKILMSALGLWPENPNQILFILTFGYFCYEMILEYLDLFLFIENFQHVLINLTENMAFSQIFIRMLMLWIYNQDLGNIIAEAKEDFDSNSYTTEEREKFISYHVKSKRFMRLLITNTAFTATSFYAKPLLGQMNEVMKYATSKDHGNSSLVFLLPYQFYTFYGMNDASTYLWTYGSQFPFVFVSGFGQSAADCLMVTLVYHVSGQMAVLAMRIRKINVDSASCTEDVYRIVKDHIRLLREGKLESHRSKHFQVNPYLTNNFLNLLIAILNFVTSLGSSNYLHRVLTFSMGKTIEDAFSETLLGHLIGATALICILGYEILLSLANGENANLVPLMAFIFLVLLVLYAHCTVGESLITESEEVNKAFYDCRWYDMSTENAKIILMCMARSQKPLQLTAGKFKMFCLTTLTESLKASMGYLSVLRQVM